MSCHGNIKNALKCHATECLRLEILDRAIRKVLHNLFQQQLYCRTSKPEANALFATQNVENDDRTKSIHAAC